MSAHKDSYRMIFHHIQSFTAFIAGRVSVGYGTMFGTSCKKDMKKYGMLTAKSVSEWYPSIK